MRRVLLCRKGDVLGALSSAGDDIHLWDVSYVSFLQELEASTTSDLDLQRKPRVQLKVFDLLGRSVNVLLDQHLERGRATIEWQPPSSVTSGVYVVRLQVGPTVLTRRAFFARQ